MKADRRFMDATKPYRFRERLNVSNAIYRYINKKIDGDKVLFMLAIAAMFGFVSGLLFVYLFIPGGIR